MERDGMSYCPKCGNKVEETMVFCPQCGTSLKDDASPIQAPTAQPYQDEKTEKNEKQEKKQHLEKNGKQEKSEYGFIGYLMGGLILITIGIFSILDLTGSPLSSSQDLAAMLTVIGVIIILGAVFIATKHGNIFRRPSKISHPVTTTQ